MSKKILKGRWFAKQNSPLHSLEKQESQRGFQGIFFVYQALATWRIPVSCENRQTENLGDFCGFQPSGMPTFQNLCFAQIEINPCQSTSNTGTKKAEWRVTIRHQDKKMVEDFYANQNLFSVFVSL